MSILVSGSLALDHLMVFPDRFKDHILPEKIHMLNVSFNIDTLETHFGGVAGNIAYNLRLLGQDPLILATVGNDFGPYAAHLDHHGIRRSAIHVIDELRTAQGFVTTDLDDNQIWAFYVGAMGRAHENPVSSVDEAIELAIVSSDGREAMIEHARELKARGVPTYVDPSHALPILDKDDLLGLIDGSAGYVVNDYEWSLTLEKTGCTESELIQRTGAVIITLGEKGSVIHHEGDEIEIPTVRAPDVVDPTGCGDAYRAGLLAGLARGLPFETAGRMASLMGALQVAVGGTQSLAIDADAFEARYQQEFGTPIP
jgi:adenosine kinase